MPNLDVFASRVNSIRDLVESYDRDPDAFGLSVWLPCGLHEDPGVIEAAQRSPQIKWYSASYGRMNQAEWQQEGLQSVFPPSRHYSRDYMPFAMTARDAEEIVAHVPPSMCERSAMWGTAEQVAKVGQDWIAAGATFLGLLDMMPLHTGPAEFPASTARVLDVARRLKSANPSI